LWLECFNEAVFCLLKTWVHISLEQRTNIEFLVKLDKTATEIYKLKANRSKDRRQKKGSPWSFRTGVGA
jgi:hypothetical protein